MATHTTPDTITAYHCPSCENIYGSHDLAALYECSRCGTVTTESRCPDCNIFAARIGDGCEACETECEEIDAVTDHDGTLIRASEWDPETSKADRDTKAAANMARTLEYVAAAEKRERDAASETIPASALAPGEWIASRDPRDDGDPVQVVAVYPWGTEVGLVVTDYGDTRVYRVDADQTVTRTPRPSSPRDRAGEYGKITYNPDGGEHLLLSSAPHREKITVQTASLSKGAAPEGGVPCVMMQRSAGSYLYTLGLYVDRGQAEAALDVWEQAARDLATAHPDAPRDTGTVEAVEEDWNTHGQRMGTPVHLTLGSGPDEPGVTYLDALVDGGHVTLGDPATLLEAIAAVRGVLGHLDH